MSRSREPTIRDERRGVGGLRRPADGASPSSAPAPAAGGGGARAPPCLRSRRAFASTFARKTSRSSRRSRSASTCLAVERLAVRPPANATTRSCTFASNGFAARWSAASRPGGAGAVTATRYVVFFESAPFSAVDPPTSRSRTQGRDEEHAAAQPLADLAPGDERDRAPPAHRATSSRKSSASDGGP